MIEFSNYPSITYAIAFTVSFWCWFLFEIWVFSRDRGKEKRGSRAGGGTVLIALAIGITLALNMPAIAAAFDIQSSFPIIFICAMVLVWGGILFRLWSIRTLGKFFSTQLIIRERHELVTTGPYKYLRNPSYTGALATFLGLGLAIGNWLSAGILLAVAVIAYAGRIRVEDRMLSEQFGGTYEAYKKRSWALVPFVW